MPFLHEEMVAWLDQQYHPLNGALARLRDTEETDIPIIRRETEQLIVLLLKMRPPERILEIGTGTGYSAAVMATAAPAAQVVTIESYEPRYRRAKANLQHLHLTDRIDMELGDARELLKSGKVPEEGAYDFIFIDAAKSHYREFWNEAVSCAAPSAVILCDNVFLSGIVMDEKYLTTRRDRTSMFRMREFLDFLASEAEGMTSILGVGDGVSITLLAGGEERSEP